MIAIERSRFSPFAGATTLKIAATEVATYPSDE
jgi:hypothetical protein